MQESRRSIRRGVNDFFVVRRCSALRNEHHMYQPTKEILLSNGFADRRANCDGRFASCSSIPPLFSPFSGHGFAKWTYTCRGLSSVDRSRDSEHTTWLEHTREAELKPIRTRPNNLTAKRFSYFRFSSFFSWFSLVDLSKISKGTKLRRERRLSWEFEIFQFGATSSASSSSVIAATSRYPTSSGILCFRDVRLR